LSREIILVLKNDFLFFRVYVSFPFFKEIIGVIIMIKPLGHFQVFYQEFADIVVFRKITI